MPSPFGAFGLQDRPLRSCGGATGTATGQFLQGAERSFRVASQFDAGGLLDSVSCSSNGGLQCRERNSRDHGLLLHPHSRIRGFKFRHHHEFVERNGHHGLSPVMALGGGGGRDMGEEASKEISGDTGDMNPQWNVNLGTSSSTSSSSSSTDADASWEQISMVFRICYSVAMYGGLAFAGHVICSFTGVDLWGGFNLSPEVITTGFGYAIPPMMFLLFILEDEIVKSWGPARAVRDVEDEELLDFFSGMSPWQFPFVVASGAIAEELFFRVAIQGGLTHALQMSDKGVTDSTVGLAALTGVIPLFVPFSQFFATALTAALTSSMYYVMTSPKDPKYVVAPVTRGRNNRCDIKERVSAWYERRQQKKIYSPLVEGLLAMYLGIEWMHTGNILAPIITHTVYSLVIVGNGLRRIHDNREKLRQRVSKISGARLARIENQVES